MIIPQPTHEEIVQIDRWIELVLPHKNEFQIVDIYTKTLTDQIYKEHSYDYWRQKAAETRAFLEKYDIINHRNTGGGEREYLTAFGLTIANAGGWVKYHNNEQEKKDQAMLLMGLEKQIKEKTLRKFKWDKWVVIFAGISIVISMGNFIWNIYSANRLNDLSDKVSRIDSTSQSAEPRFDTIELYIHKQQKEVAH